MNRYSKFVWLIIVATMVIGVFGMTSTVFAQDNYLLAGTTHPSNRAPSDTRYDAVWTNDGRLWQPNLPRASEREWFAVAIELVPGRYEANGVACRVYVDEDRSGGGSSERLVADHENQSAEDTSFEVRTSTGLTAYALVECDGGVSTGIEILWITSSGFNVNVAGIRGSANPQATSPANATPMPGSNVPTYMGRPADEVVQVSTSGNCGTDMVNGVSDDIVDNNQFGWHRTCSNGSIHYWMTYNPQQGGQGGMGGAMPTQTAPMMPTQPSNPQGNRITPASCSPTDAARPGYVLIPSTDARWQTATDCSTMYEFNLSYCPSTDPVGRTLNRDLSAYQGTNLSCQYLPLERNEEQQDVVPQWLKDAGEGIWGFVRANWVWIIVLIAIALWLRSRNNSGHGHTAAPAAAAAHPAPAHPATPARTWRNAFGLLPSGTAHAHRMTLAPTTIQTGSTGTFTVTGHTGTLNYRVNPNGTGLTVDPVSGVYGGATVVGVARVTVYDDHGHEEFDVNVTATAPAPATPPATPIPAPAPAITAAWGDVTPNTGAAATALPIHIRLTNADTLTATKVEVGTATVTITGMTRDAVGHMLTVNAEIPASTLTPGGMYPIKVTLADGTVITSPANAFTAS